MSIVSALPSHGAILSLYYVLVLDERVTECDALVVLALIIPEGISFHLLFT
jgi:hypothetical protein